MLSVLMVVWKKEGRVYNNQVKGLRSLVVSSFKLRQHLPSIFLPSTGCGARADRLLGHRKSPLVVEQEFEAPEDELGGHDVEVDRVLAQRKHKPEVEMLQQSQGGRRERPHQADRGEVPRQGVALAAIGAEVDEVVPANEEEGAQAEAAGRDRQDGQAGVCFQPFERGRDEQVIHQRAGQKPADAGVELLLRLGAGGRWMGFHGKGWLPRDEQRDESFVG